MKRLLWGFGFLLLSLAVLMNVQAQTAAPSHAAPPSATASPFMPPPTALPSSTPIAVIPALQTINADNLGQLQPLFSVVCSTPAINNGVANEVRSLLWSPVSNVLAIGVHQKVCLYDLNTPESQPLILAKDSILLLAFSPDGKKLATLVYEGGKDRVHFWDVASGREQESSLEASYYDGSNNSTLAYSPNGRYIATLPDLGGLNLYDADTEDLLVHVPLTNQAGVYFNGDGRRLVTVGSEGISLWTLLRGPRLYRDTILPIKLDYRDIRLTLGGEGRNRLMYPLDDNVMIYDLEQNQPLGDQTLEGRFGRYLFLPDGTIVSTYEPNSLHPIHPALQNANYPTFSADGTLLAAVYWPNDIVQLWGVPQ